MTFGGNVYQLSFAVIIGILCALGSQSARSEAGALGAKASFLTGATYLLMQHHWWPTTASVFALMTWVFSGWLISSLSYELTARMRLIFKR